MDPNEKAIKQDDIQTVNKTVKVLRIVGPIILFLGIGGLITGILLTTRLDHKYMFIIFLSMFILFAGLVTTILAYISAMQKYVAINSAPVVKDTTNYMVEGTSDAVSNLAGKVADKVYQPKQGKQIVCPNCHLLNDEGRKYCGECGESLVPKKDKESVEEK